MSAEFFGTSRRGIEYLKTLKEDDIISIEKVRSKRSLQQNKFYFLCLGVIADNVGHTPDELHVLFKGLYLPKKTIQVGEKKYSIPVSTTSLSKKDFGDYMDRIGAEAGTLGITLPDPEEYHSL